MTDKISNDAKTILSGRIYPAIQSCVNNRYKIIIGYFVTIGFLLLNKEKLTGSIGSNAALYISIIFFVFVLHNSINYSLNAKDQRKLEGVENGISIFDISSSVIMVLLIIGGYCLFK